MNGKCVPAERNETKSSRERNDELAGDRNLEIAISQRRVSSFNGQIARRFIRPESKRALSVIFGASIFNGYPGTGRISFTEEHRSIRPRAQLGATTEFSSRPHPHVSVQLVKADARNDCPDRSTAPSSITARKVTPSPKVKSRDRILLYPFRSAFYPSHSQFPLSFAMVSP